ncbi:MAG: GIY-YIG nuclease family protein [Holophagales bacterium]|nr:GIY-YIG nuclease family protein [Holophagales bacterium]
MVQADYSLYIVRCNGGTLYTGIATDVHKRLEEHRGGRRGAKYLRGRGPIELVFTEVAGDRVRASQLEYRVKRLPRSEKLALIDGRRDLADLLRGHVLDDNGA